MKYLKYIFLLVIALVISAFVYLNNQVSPAFKFWMHDYHGELPIEKLKLPPNYKIEVYAEGVENARSMAYGADGTLYVGTRSKGNVYAIPDEDKDMKGDTVITIFENGNMPNGVALDGDDLYVAEVNRILKFEDISKDLTTSKTPKVIYDQYPTEEHHGWKYIAFGPDGRLYVPVGAPCNICESEEPIFNTITSIKKDGTDLRIEQKGIRNTVGFTWEKSSDHLYFTDNGRDWLGDDIPACELNRATQIGQHFGYPYCHQGDLLDPEYGEDKNCEDYIAPIQKMGPHTAPLGVEFIDYTLFPKSDQREILIAEHGSWNRSKKIGYQISKVTLDDTGSASSYEPFITGWLETDENVWGRPVDLEFLPDGSLLISDDFAHAIYRVYPTENNN